MSEDNIIEGVANNLQLVIEYPFVKIYVSIDSGFVYGDWIGTPSVDQIMVGVESELEVMKKYSIWKLLINTSKVRGTWTASQSWIMNDWWPRAVDAGFRKIAFIYSKDIFTRFARLMHS